jgi:hypothetical protein
MNSLGIEEGSKYKPKAETIGRMLVKLKLIDKDKDILRKSPTGGVVYVFYRNKFVDILQRLQKFDLLNKYFLGWESEVSEPSEPSELSGKDNKKEIESLETEGTESSDRTEVPPTQSNNKMKEKEVD